MTKLPWILKSVYVPTKNFLCRGLMKEMAAAERKQHTIFLENIPKTALTIYAKRSANQTHPIQVIVSLADFKTSNCFVKKDIQGGFRTTVQTPNALL